VSDMIFPNLTTMEMHEVGVLYDCGVRTCVDLCVCVLSRRTGVKSVIE
jgi:hypothetical protein